LDEQIVAEVQEDPNPEAAGLETQPSPDERTPDQCYREARPEDIERYRQARVRGEVSGKRVGARAVAADLVSLQTMLNWATSQRTVRNEPLLDRNPLRGVKLPREKNPKRPVESYDRYVKLMKVAGDVDWRLPLALTLAESTGRRLSSILNLRREDLDLDRLTHGWLKFDAVFDKIGREAWVPLAEYSRRVLRAHLKQLPEDSEWLFPSEAKREQSVDRSTMDKRLRKAYKRVELETPDGGLWHAWRRKWATERKHMPLKDVAEAGGWRQPQTLIRCYQQSDAETFASVVLEAPKLNSTPILLQTPQAGG
jgi:integrase